MSEKVSEEVPEAKIEMAEKELVDEKRLLTAEDPPKEETSKDVNPDPPPASTVRQTDSSNDDESDACAMLLQVISIIILILFFPFSLICALKMVQEYERAVIFRLGRIIGGSKGPGLFFIYPCMDTMVTVDLRTRSFDINPQEILTKDQLTVTVDAVMYLKIIDPIASVTKIENVNAASKMLGATTLRNVLGTYNMTDILSQRDEINTKIKVMLDEATDPWGVDVERVEITDVCLPQQMQRAMAAEAEATREARAKIIAAEGEQKAARALKEAADVMAESPAAIQLRYLQTLNNISAEKNSTIIFPLPMEFMQTFRGAPTIERQ
ncbi:hypothetical protein ACF0H5_021840 [Mactra antiquata]